MLGFNLLAALMAIYMLARHGPLALALLRGGGTTAERARAVVPLLTCLAALGVLAASARLAYLALTRTPGGLP